MIEFKPWPKIARLNRDITITEKIDGTNSAVGVSEFGQDDPLDASPFACFPLVGDQRYQVYAQSRKNLITPERDNFGFARWVRDNAETLAATLGPGLHFGEWWGAGIQRGYGLPKGDRRFSLFNTKRWADCELFYMHAGCSGLCKVPGLGVVPVLYEGLFNAPTLNSEGRWVPRWEKILDELRDEGSAASPGFMRPEGIVIYHHAANEMFKVTLENDEEPKALAKARSST